MVIKAKGTYKLVQDNIDRKKRDIKKEEDERLKELADDPEFTKSLKELRNEQD